MIEGGLTLQAKNLSQSSFILSNPGVVEKRRRCDTPSRRLLEGATRGPPPAPPLEAPLHRRPGRRRRASPPPRQRRRPSRGVQKAPCAPLSSPTPPLPPPPLPLQRRVAGGGWIRQIHGHRHRIRRSSPLIRRADSSVAGPCTVLVALVACPCRRARRRGRSARRGGWCRATASLSPCGLSWTAVRGRARGSAAPRRAAGSPSVRHVSEQGGPRGAPTASDLPCCWHRPLPGATATGPGLARANDPRSGPGSGAGWALSLHPATAAI